MYNNNYPYYPQQVAAPKANYYDMSRLAPLTLKGHPVTSLEEARASSIDFDGSIFYFPDLANKRIYTKQINLDGTALLNMYELKEIPVEPTIAIEPANFITREEFEAAIEQLKSTIPIAEKKPINF